MVKREKRFIICRKIRNNGLIKTGSVLLYNGTCIYFEQTLGHLGRCACGAAMNDDVTHEIFILNN
jgi:hypothetical protein